MQIRVPTLTGWFRVAALTQETLAEGCPRSGSELHRQHFYRPCWLPPRCLQLKGILLVLQMLASTATSRRFLRRTPDTTCDTGGLIPARVCLHLTPRRITHQNDSPFPIVRHAALEVSRIRPPVAPTAAPASKTRARLKASLERE